MGIHDRITTFGARQLHEATNLGNFGLGWVEDQMVNMGDMAFSYPGDKSVPVDYAEAMCHDPKGRGFPRLAMRAVLGSAHKAGAVITPQVYEDVKRMAVGPEATDTYLDNVGGDADERQRRHEVVIGAGLDIMRGRFDSDNGKALLAEEPLVYGGLRYYANALRTMPDEAQKKISEHAVKMLTLSLEKSLAPSLREYAGLAYDEGREYAHIWAYTVWARQGAGSRPKFEKYDPWISELLGRMLLVAAGTDLGRDIRNKEVILRPVSVLGGRLFLAGKGLAKLPKVAWPLVRARYSKQSPPNPQPSTSR